MAKFWRIVLTVVTVALYALGWTAGIVVVAGLWVGTSVRVGWQHGSHVDMAALTEDHRGSR